LKKNPIKIFEKKTGLYSYVGITAGESRLRQQSYSKYGCNAFNKNPPASRPIMFWAEKDIWDYIHLNNLSYDTIYDKGVKRTGCMFCMFGIQYEDKFGILKEIHQEIYEYCMNKLGCKEVLKFIGNIKKRRR
jgi:3'-phosphoadenosine 5'-phosphosulfate sulfotransferase (PAPS reductase)/FAD synthetase